MQAKAVPAPWKVCQFERDDMLVFNLTKYFEPTRLECKGGFSVHCISTHPHVQEILRSFNDLVAAKVRDGPAQHA